MEVDESLFQDMDDLDLDEDDPDFNPLDLGSDEDWSVFPVNISSLMEQSFSSNIQNFSVTTTQDAVYFTVPVNHISICTNMPLKLINPLTCFPAHSFIHNL